ncbi:hypothetical protein SBOR_6280 [Sclerotinia borealis F-4128]|uniref:DNA repair protein RAD51 homolog 3 n=1 Tax=Sclerotinia borealis (strain F-4128) TaxID=1432307 RepID=W9CC21_SCLBF|nr:hypothetical protein SBOR_6280 [Sclerotinia borealis F-4128]
MDYQTIHGPGRSNFSSSSPHRMPTVSAAQALQGLETSPTRWISTGLKHLDLALQNKDPLQVSASTYHNYGGISRGKVTEFYGPSGVGKTAFGMHLAATVLHRNEGVVWVDASHLISGPRFSQILQEFPSPDFSNYHGLLTQFNHFCTPTLSHLLALLTHTASNFPPENTSLIIIDSFSTLIDNAFPRNFDSISPKKPGGPKYSSRKFPLLQYLINALQRLATTRNIAILILNQCVTKMRPGLGAALIPAISATAWEHGLGCRVALFRDWGWDNEDGGKVNGVRFAQVIKAESVTLSEGRGGISAFVVGEFGISAVTLPSPSTFASPSRGLPSLPKSQLPIATGLPPQKRKRAEFEIPDSDDEDDEDYGWAEEDEELPPMPPQWQGSEDILVPPPGEMEAEEELEEAEENEGAIEGDKDGDNYHAERLLEIKKTGTYRIERELPDSEDTLAL